MSYLTYEHEPHIFSCTSTCSTSSQTDLSLTSELAISCSSAAHQTACESLKMLVWSSLFSTSVTETLSVTRWLQHKFVYFRLHFSCQSAAHQQLSIKHICDLALAERKKENFWCFNKDFFSSLRNRHYLLFRIIKTMREIVIWRWVNMISDGFERQKSLQSC